MARRNNTRYQTHSGKVYLWLEETIPDTKYSSERSSLWLEETTPDTKHSKKGLVYGQKKLWSQTLWKPASCADEKSVHAGNKIVDTDWYQASKQK